MTITDITANTTESVTTTDTDLAAPNPERIDVREGPTPEPHHRPRRRPGAGAIAIVAAVAASVGATALLVDRATDAPDPAPVQTPLSGNDAAVGYILSAEYPAEFHDASDPSTGLNGTDAALGYILSADYPTAIHDTPSPSTGLSGNDAALGYILSADYPVSEATEAGDVADPIGVIFTAEIADLEQ